MPEAELRSDGEHGQPEAASAHMQETDDAPADDLRSSRGRFRFVHKIMLLIMGCICLTAISIASVSTMHFKRQLYQQEYSAAFTVYTAAANYLSGHYKSNNDQYVSQSIDYVLRRKFLRLAGIKGRMITHRPARLTLYDTNGRVIYDYVTSPTAEKQQDLPRSVLPLSYGPEYFPEKSEIRIAGPVSPTGDIPGYVEIYFVTDIRDKVMSLFRQSAVTMLAVFLVAAALAWIFARHALAPVEALTRAAHRVHHGELDQEVAVTTDDEIGELATTFNEMVASVSRRITLLHRIQEWTVKIGKELESERLYGTLVAMFSLMSGARTCRLYIYNDADGKLESRMERGGSHLPPPDDDTLAKQAFEERWVQYMTDKGAVTDDFTKGRQIAIPLLTGDRRIGVIRIGAKPDRTAYDEETLTILQTLAQHASVAADNAHLYEELAEKERIEQEMRWARRIQQSMLPRETPSLPGYEVAGKSLPAREVGGDYFDFMTTDGLSWYMVVADVSGKGVPAALIMSIVRSLLHTFTELETTPGEVLTRVNRKLSNDLEPDMFVTTAAVLLDPMQHTVSIARGGHEPIIIRRADGSTERVEPQGAALGLLDVDLFEHALENYETPIAEHEVIVLYTDGVTEARNAAGEEFGIDRLETIVREKGDLPAAELLEQIKAEVLAFASGVMQHDDITLVVLRRQG